MSRYIHRFNFTIGDAEKDSFNAAIYAVDGEEAGPETVTLPLPEGAEDPTHWGSSGVYTEAQRLLYEPILDNYSTLSWWRLNTVGELVATNVEASEDQIGLAFTWEECLADVGLSA